MLISVGIAACHCASSTAAPAIETGSPCGTLRALIGMGCAIPPRSKNSAAKEAQLADSQPPLEGFLVADFLAPNGSKGISSYASEAGIVLVEDPTRLVTIPTIPEERSLFSIAHLLVRLRYLGYHGGVSKGHGVT